MTNGHDSKFQQPEKNAQEIQMNSSRIDHVRTFGLIAASAVFAFASSVCSAQPAESKQALAPAATKAEQRADLALWIRSGARDLQTAASYGPFGPSLAYDRAVATYWKWRNGPEFAAELAKEQSALKSPTNGGR